MSPRHGVASFRWSATRTGIVIFVLVVAAGPVYTAPGYSAVANLISELAAQNTPRNFLMSGAFLALGAGIAIDGLRPFSRALAPFVAFGIFMALAGLFSHKPITEGVSHVGWVHGVHSALGTAAGIAITVAFAWQAVRQPTPARRMVAGVLAVLCFALPLAMLSFPGVQGVIQRLMYLLVFAWLWLFYPAQVRGGGTRREVT